MIRNITILILAVTVVALPFIFRHKPEASRWKPGDPELIVISAHNEAIRFEFGRAFSSWHAAKFGRPVKVDWRSIGGTSEIMRYLAAEYVSAYRAWYRSLGNQWPANGGSMMLDRRFNPDRIPEGDDPAARADWETKKAIWAGFRDHDDPATFSARIDLFFGGGEYDHNKASRQGLTVAPWADGEIPEGLVADGSGAELIPSGRSGERWRTSYLYGVALSTFGICYNYDRLEQLNVDHPPREWKDLTDPAYIGQLGAADPTKSGSISKAFEMIIHQQCYESILDAGYDDGRIAEYEAAIRAHKGAGEMPGSVPDAYQEALERGWLQGVLLVQRIGANARYFTDSSSKIPIDVSMGDAAVGLAIDFYGRYQAEKSRGPDGRERMQYVTPNGGSSVSADPISLMRGAPHREIAIRFMEFVLSEDGQRLWNYRPGTPGGPVKFALRRLPVRRDFYPSDDTAMNAKATEHAAHTSDDLLHDDVNPYQLSKRFTYYSRWTAGHFNIHRDLIRAMCLDAGEELRAAWRAIVENGGPEVQVEAMSVLTQLPDNPVPLSWESAPAIPKDHSRLDYMREWTIFFRDNYRQAGRLAAGEG
jgi:ABC-type Fe3+ transport system substrate-binding protein